MQARAPKWKVDQLEKELQQLKDRAVRREKAEAEEGLILARTARQEEELQEREARAPSPVPTAPLHIALLPYCQLRRTGVRSGRGSQRLLLAGQGGGVH